MTQSEPVGLRRADTSERSGVAADDPLLGAVLDSRYLIERVVGSGGFGVVYRAVHLRFDSPVAIKVLRIPKRLSDEERARFIELFLAEGKLLFTLGAVHPSIVRVFESGTLHAADGLLAPYLVMEWLDGVPLDRELQSRSELGTPHFNIEQVIDLLGFCAEGLARAHERRIAHHDIKPGNIFLVQHEGRLATKLLDFGLAKASHDTVTTTTAPSEDGAGHCAFTPAYGAPEQWLRRLGATGTWSDVYAFALVCGELLTGQRALLGRDAQQLMAACLDEAVRPTPRTLGACVSDEVEAVFSRALSVSPRHRYPDMRVFWEELCRSAAGSRATHDGGNGRTTTTDHATWPALRAVETGGTPLATAPTGPQRSDLARERGAQREATVARPQRLRSRSIRGAIYASLAIGVILSLGSVAIERRTAEAIPRRIAAHHAQQAAPSTPATAMPIAEPIAPVAPMAPAAASTRPVHVHGSRRRPIAPAPPAQPTPDSRAAVEPASSTAASTSHEREDSHGLQDLLNHESLSRRK